MSLDRCKTYDTEDYRAVAELHRYPTGYERHVVYVYEKQSYGVATGHKLVEQIRAVDWDGAQERAAEVVERYQEQRGDNAGLLARIRDWL